MNKTLMKVQALYSEMGSSEKKVADFIMQDPSKVIAFSIRELAKASGSSEATIVRFSRRLGQNGYQDFRLALARDGEEQILTPYIEEDDDCYGIFEKICSDMYLSLERTKRSLSPDSMGKASEAILHARKVVLIGLGSSASVAGDASDKLLRVGCNSTSYSDTHMQMIVASTLTQEDVMIGISQSGSSKDIVEALKIAKQNGATIIAVTSKEKSPTAKLCDILLLTDTEEVRHFSQGFASHLARRLVMDALVYKVVQESERTLQGNLDAGEEALRSKRVYENS